MQSSASFIEGPSGPLECLITPGAEPQQPITAILCHPHPLFSGTMNNKVITMLQGSVAEEQWGKLQDAYQKLTKEKSAIAPVQSFIVQDTKEPVLWKIITVWENMESLQKMRNSGDVPIGIRVFRAALSEPTLSVLKVVEEL